MLPTTWTSICVDSRLPDAAGYHRLEHRLRERFVRAMATFRLIDDDDRILVGLSGGKDSLLLLQLLAQRSRIQHPRFAVEAIHVRMENIRYETDTGYLQQFCHDLGVPLHVVTTRFDAERDSSTDLHRQKQPCFLCSWMRRKQMFNLAQQLGCNKIALGHHQDDILHTALMNLTFQGRFDTMPVRLRMRKMPLTLIRPLCLIQETDIKAFAEMSGYQKQQKLCPYETESHRTEIRNVYEELERMNPEARHSIWRALETNDKLIED